MYNSIVALNRDGERFTAELCSNLRQMAVLRDDGKYAMNYLTDSVSSLHRPSAQTPRFLLPNNIHPNSPEGLRRAAYCQRARHVGHVRLPHTTYPLNPKCSKFAPGSPHEEMESGLRSDPASHAAARSGLA